MFIRVDKDQLSDEDIVSILKLNGVEIDLNYMGQQPISVWEGIRSEVEREYIYEDVTLVKNRAKIKK